MFRLAPQLLILKDNCLSLEALFHSSRIMQAKERKYFLQPKKTLHGYQSHINCHPFSDQDMTAFSPRWEGFSRIRLHLRALNKFDLKCQAQQKPQSTGNRKYKSRFTSEKKEDIPKMNRKSMICSPLNSTFVLTLGSQEMSLKRIPLKKSLTSQRRKRDTSSILMSKRDGVLIALLLN